MDALRDVEQRDAELVAIRPKFFSEFIGQDSLCENLQIFLNATKERGEPLDHVLLHGPPGLGKTTLAQVVAHEMGVNIKITSGPIITKSGELAAILTNLRPGDILFIDEIHRLNVSVEEILYSAMEDFKLDILIGDGPAARSIRIDLSPFTLVGATTRSGLLTQPLRERFGIPLRLQYYDKTDLCKIIKRTAQLLNTEIDEGGAQAIALRSRGTPRIAGRLLRRCRDFATVKKSDVISQAIAQHALDQLDVDHRGLDFMDIQYLKVIADFYGGGPAGLETIAAALSEQKDTIEDVIEPYLIQNGFIQRTARGRVLTNLAYTHLGMPSKARQQQILSE